MSKLVMKAPRNSGGFSVGNSVYAPDGDSKCEVAIEHVTEAKSHGWAAAEAEQDLPQPAQSDPNVQRAGPAEPPVAPGGDTVVTLTDAESEKAVADATTAKGELLTDAEKAAAVDAALEAKKSTGAAAPAEAKDAKAK